MASILGVFGGRGEEGFVCREGWLAKAATVGRYTLGRQPRLGAVPARGRGYHAALLEIVGMRRR